jgi:hypothetical protein
MIARSPGAGLYYGNGRQACRPFEKPWPMKEMPAMWRFLWIFFVVLAATSPEAKK